MARDDNNKNDGGSGGITYSSLYYLHPSDYPKQIRETRTPHESTAFKTFQRCNGPPGVNKEKVEPNLLKTEIYTAPTATKMVIYVRAASSNSEGTKPVANMALEEDEEGEWILIRVSPNTLLIYLAFLLIKKPPTSRLLLLSPMVIPFQLTYFFDNVTLTEKVGGLVASNRRLIDLVLQHWVFLIKNKSEDSKRLIDFHKMVEVQFEKKIKRIRPYVGNSKPKSMLKFVSSTNSVVAFRDSLDDNKGVSSEGPSITNIPKEGPSIARRSREPISKELLEWYRYDTGYESKECSDDEDADGTNHRYYNVDLTVRKLEKSARGKMIRSKNVNHHKIGRGGDLFVKNKMMENKEIKADEEPSCGIMWLKGRVNKDEEFTDDEIISVGDKLEKEGYATGVGSGVTYKRYFYLPQSRQATDERIELLQTQLDNAIRERQQKDVLVKKLSTEMTEKDVLVKKLSTEMTEKDVLVKKLSNEMTETNGMHS
nr:hypothetical protein [Tanacetum cinerariifolium]